MPSEKPSAYLATRIVLGIALFMACAGLLLLGRSRSVLTHLDQHTLPGVDMAGEIKQSPSQLYVRVLEYQASDAADAAELERIRKDYDRTSDEFSALLAKYRDYRTGGAADEGGRRLVAVETSFREFDAFARDFVRRGPDVTAADLSKLESAFRRFDAESDALFAFKWSRAGQWVVTSVGYAETAVIMTAGLLVLMLLLFLGFLIRALALGNAKDSSRKPM